ncbi:major facilitator superfamily domain-containing protein [Xylaria palmicola]|nr:major facilitator superfamily domain-containing protein [Xylaria palmicola]
MSRPSDERAPLLRPELPQDYDAEVQYEIPKRVALKGFTQSPVAALPIALFSALALAATAATQIYSYASILCKDAQHCDDSERRKFATSVAIATTLANVCALLSIRGFEVLSKRHTRTGLGIWIVIRSCSVFALALGVFVRNLGIAMSSQVFEGLASDNILHFNLNSLYVRADSATDTSKLIGSSLALYMIGISLSPSIAGVLSNFRYSFVMAYGLFIVAFMYLIVAVRVPPRKAFTHPDHRTSGDAGDESVNPTPSLLSRLSELTGSPVRFLVVDPWRLLPGLALFFYNAAQSYTFSALMVHTSVDFGFSSRENGFLLTIVHAVASLYLFMVLFLIPKASSVFARRKTQTLSTAPRSHESAGDDERFKDASLAIVSLFIQAAALILVAFAQKPWQIYSASALLALGLACPGFLKSYFAASFEATEKPKALAFLAVMESCGSLIAPIILGGLQAAWPGGSIFIVAALSVCLASALLFIGLIVDRRRTFHRDSHPHRR